MAKISRENALRERRLRKQARKNARKQAAESPAPPATDPLAGSAPKLDDA